MKVGIEDQITEIKRELMMREQVYPTLISAGKLEKRVADLRQRDMAAVLRTLEFLRDNRETLVLAHEIGRTPGATQFVKGALEKFPGAQVRLVETDQ